MGNRISRQQVWPLLVVLGVIGCYAIPVGMMGNTAGIFVQPVMKEFGWDQTSTTMYRTIQPLVAALCTPLAGRLMAKYDARVLLTLASGLFGVATLGTAFATELWQWNLYGAIYGVTCAFFMYMAAPLMVNRWFANDAGKVLGIIAAVLSLLAAIATPITQSAINSLGWQSARVWLCAIATILSIVLTAGFLRNSPEEMGLLPWGGKNAKISDTGEAPELEGARASQAARSGGLYLILLIAAIIVMTAAFFQQIPTYAAQSSLGADAGAMAVSIVMVGGIVGKLLLGWMSDHVGIRQAARVALGCGGLGIALVFIAGGTQWLFYAGMGVFGFGYAALTVVVPLLVRGAFGLRDYPKIYSWVSTVIFLATSLSFIVYGRISDLTGSFTASFILVIVLYVIGFVVVGPALKSAQSSWMKQTEEMGQSR